MNEITVTVCSRAVHALMHVCAACDAWEVHKWGLVCAWHGIEAQNGQSVKNKHKYKPKHEKHD